MFCRVHYSIRCTYFGGLRWHSTKRPVRIEVPKVYDCSLVESQWYDWWEKNDFFNVDLKASDVRSRVICLPPPNVTGNLHIGHALTVAIEDTIARWRRMCGDRICWIPGFDHAGIATQLVVERRLRNLKGLTRTDLNREQLIEECLSWKNDKVREISGQLKKLGASLDWSRSYYTMDEKFSEAVYSAFRLLFDQNLIQRSRRLVNWSPYLKSTLSDVEINNVKISEPTDLPVPGCKSRVPVGLMYYVDYELFDQPNRTLTVATTRPETIPADVAIAVNPDDSRYNSYLGYRVRNPLRPDVLLPIIADSTVDKTLGTGVLKVTPGHDWNDYAIGVRHGLPLDVNIFNDDGTFVSTQNLDELCNLNRFEARRKVVDILRAVNKLKDVKAHETSLPVCSRTGDIVEPMLKDQWFLSTKTMASKLLRVLDEKEMSIVPKFYEHLMRIWLTGSDWCISRQLWWGHRIPVFRATFDDYQEKVQFIVARTVEDARSEISLKFPGKNLVTLDQESDVLDTWFSSCLVPLIVSGWPKNFRQFSSYPLMLMETGHDILSFWVTRMAMLCLHISGEIPFKEILLHGIVRDAHGRKMSKSLGNVIDPLDVIEGKSLEELEKRLDVSDLDNEEKRLAKEGLKKNFPKGILKCGSDSLRYSLLMNDIKKDSINVSMSIIEANRNFCNKIWQGFNYMKPVYTKFICSPLSSKDSYYQRMSVVDFWILNQLSDLVRTVNRGLNGYEFSVAVQACYEFWRTDFCDVYLEWTKPFVWNNEVEELKRTSRVFTTVADVFLRTIAPFMPFIAEELHCGLPWIENDRSVHQREFPTADTIDFTQPLINQEMNSVQSILRIVRSLKTEFGLPLKTAVNGFVVGNTEGINSVNKFCALLERNSTNLVTKLSTEFSSALDPNRYVSAIVNNDLQLYLEFDNIDKKAVSERLEKQIMKRKRTIQQLESKAQFVAKLSEKRNKTMTFDPTNSVNDLHKEIERLEQILMTVRN